MYTSFSKSGIDPVKIAVIGAGNRARKYLEYAVMHPDELNIVAIVDPVEIRLDQLSDKFNITIITTFSRPTLTSKQL